ncbi:MAG: aldo/keto reductase [Firmicutes bacterium]|nr:aldo/keto reductase [Bacillota bacterium]
MIYKKFRELELSQLGFGCMRLPLKSEDSADIDPVQVQEMFDCAMEAGVNYYDVAWGYHKHMAEVFVGEALKKYPRESFYLATKFPGYDLANMPKVKEIFEEQLERLQVDHFDFYLCHNVTEYNIEAYLDPSYGIVDYLKEQKAAGRIKHLGFSCHGQMDVLKRFVEAYGDDMEFCQIQLNYLDWLLQKAEAKVAYLNSMEIPVWVMEPVRGGKLASLEAKYEEKLKALRPEEKPAAWALRFAFETEGVGMVLSGMSNLEQVKENIATASSPDTLFENERETLLEIAREMMDETAYPCTGCAYCTEYCPMQLNIPKIMQAYNDMAYAKGGFLTPIVYNSLPEGHRPEDCLACGACAGVCPQSLDIPGMMSDFTVKYAEYYPPKKA